MQELQMYMEEAVMIRCVDYIDLTLVFLQSAILACKACMCMCQCVYGYLLFCVYNILYRRMKNDVLDQLPSKTRKMVCVCVCVCGL